MKHNAPHWTRDLTSALVVTVLSIPQGIAYAMIAGMPPAAGLYAAALPTVVGSLLRSSRHVITGPTNAVSLIVGAMLAQHAQLDPIAAAGLLAVLVGIMQALAGAMRLGVLVDYISTSVVAGYITGAALLILTGQLENLTGVPLGQGTLPERLYPWVLNLGGLDTAAVAIGLGTAVAIKAIRHLYPRAPSEVIGVAGAIAVVAALDIHVPTLSSLGAIPRTGPQLALPTAALPDLWTLLPVAVAASILSLVESASVGRAISGQSGQRLELDREFVGQGLANVVAGVVGALPTSGSLTRSMINFHSGAQTRWAGAFAGMAMLVVPPLFGPVLDRIPIAALAGLLVVVATSLIRPQHLRQILSSNRGDAMAFIATLVGTWVLPLDRAIVLGVGISLIMFLRRARHLVITELKRDREGRLRESEDGRGERVPGVRILHVEGQLFFAAARELEAALNDAIADEDATAIVVRLKRTQGLDLTTAEVLVQASKRLQDQGRHLFLVGMRPTAMQMLESSGVTEHLGEEYLFPTQRRWFAAMEEAVESAQAAAGEMPDTTEPPRAESA